MDVSNRQHLEALRSIHQRRLRHLEQQSALLGLMTPPEITLQIEDLRQKLDALSLSIVEIDTKVVRRDHRNTLATYRGVILVCVSVLLVIMAVYFLRIPPNKNFTYQIHVQSRTGKDISNTEVKIEMSNIPPLRSITDANGYAVFVIDSNYLEKLGRIIIETDGYKRFELNVYLRKETTTVRLTPLQ